MFTYRRPAYTIALLLGACCSVPMFECQILNASEAETTARAVPIRTGVPESGWRRTVAGWEQVGDWRISSDGQTPTQATRIHPGLVAAFILLVSLAALVAFDPPRVPYRNINHAELKQARRIGPSRHHIAPQATTDIR